MDASIYVWVPTDRKSLDIVSCGDGADAVMFAMQSAVYQMMQRDGCHYGMNQSADWFVLCPGCLKNGKHNEKDRKLSICNEKEESELERDLQNSNFICRAVASVRLCKRNVLLQPCELLLHKSRWLAIPRVREGVDLQADNFETKESQPFCDSSEKAQGAHAKLIKKTY